MTLIPRNGPDLPSHPDWSAETAVLADVTDPRAENFYDHTIGDLIVEALVGRPLVDDIPSAADAWESFEAGVLARTALELKFLNYSMAVPYGGDDLNFDPPSDAEQCDLLRGIIRRTEAAVEICLRMRKARWGNPHFGGGPKRDPADAQKAADLGREEAQRWLQDTKRGTTDLPPRTWARQAFGEPEKPWAFASTAPSLDKESAWVAFELGFAEEIAKHGFTLRDGTKDTE